MGSAVVATVIGGDVVAGAVVVAMAVVGAAVVGAVAGAATVEGALVGATGVSVPEAPHAVSAAAQRWPRRRAVLTARPLVTTRDPCRQSGRPPPLLNADSGANGDRGEHEVAGVDGTTGELLAVPVALSGMASEFDPP